MFLWSSNFLFAWCILQNCLTACKKRSLYSSSSAGVLEAQLGAANKIPQILFAWCVLLLKRTYIHTSSLEKYPIFAKSLHFYQEAGKRRSLNQIWFFLDAPPSSGELTHAINLHIFCGDLKQRQKLNKNCFSRLF